MPPKKRRPSLLEDDDLVQIEDRRGGESDGDLCESCECPRRDHGDKGCKCGKCDAFEG